MIKKKPQKLWQKVYKYSPRFITRMTFWRRMGNPYSVQCIIICDYCGFEVRKANYQFPHWAAHYGESDGKQLCIPCYEINKLLK